MIAVTDMPQFGQLALCAEDMYDSAARRRLADDPRIAQLGWEIIGYFEASRAILPKQSERASGENKRIHTGEMVYFGYLARNRANGSQYAAVIRGTEGLAEWIIDAEFAPTPYRGDSAKSVEQGFWGVYDSMRLLAKDGRPVGASGGRGRGVDFLGADGSVTVAGHSLGSALATYLSLEIALLAKNRVAAALFASPRAGNKAFADFYDATVGPENFLVVNYALDVVTHVPFSTPAFDYSPLSHVELLTPHAAKADIRLDVGCNHHLVCYLAMIDYAYEQTMDKRNGDQALCDQCILGPAEYSINEAFASLASGALGYFTSPESLIRFARQIGWRPV